jgi:hypothetical protein
MRSLVLFILLLLSPVLMNGQEYRHAIGIRGSYFNPGIEYRYFIDYKNSVKALLSSRDRGLQLHGLYEIHRFNIFEFSDRFVFFYGAGLHAGYQRWDELEKDKLHTKTLNHTLAGIDGLAGLEYYFRGVPVLAGLEVKPYVDIFGRVPFDATIWDFAFTIKYLF